MPLSLNYDKTLLDFLTFSNSPKFMLFREITSYWLTIEDVELDCQDDQPPLLNPTYVFTSLEAAYEAKEKYQRDYLFFGIEINLEIICEDHRGQFWHVYEEDGKWYVRQW